MSTVERAWAAGFFDGEGSVYTRHTKKHKGVTTGKMYPLTTVEMSLCQIRKEPLERFHKAVGVGRISGPYKPKTPNSQPYWRWNTAGRPSSNAVLTTLWRYLSLPKREQALAVWVELESLKTPKSPKLPKLPKMKGLLK